MGQIFITLYKKDKKKFTIKTNKVQQGRCLQAEHTEVKALFHVSNGQLRNVMHRGSCSQ